MRKTSGILAFAALAGIAAPSAAQRTGENAVTAAEDAFGTSVGNESIGLYNSEEVRGFSPAVAGNLRIGGLYVGGIGLGNPRLQAGSTVHVGLSAQGYPFPAPTGIVEFSLRPAGPDPTLSAGLNAGPQRGFEVDGQFPLTADLSLAGGVSFNRFIDAPGGDFADYLVLGIAPAWRPSAGTEVRAFYGLQKGFEDRSTPFIFVSGEQLPPDIPHRFQGQSWASWRNNFHLMGAFGHTPLGPWRLSAGVFRQLFDNPESYNTLFVDTQSDGSSRYLVAIHPHRTSRSNAGEIRLSRGLEEGPRHHDLHLSVKGRDRTGDFGGEHVADFGPVTVGEVPPRFAKPDVEFGEETFDKVRQFTGGVAYHGRWRGVGEVSVGIQKTNYRKSVTPPDDPAIVTRAQPWLWNGTLAVNLLRGLIAYAGYTQGLEDSGVAPEIAVNRSEAPPALLTSQRDIGIRYAFGPMRLVVGGFDVRKPYFNLGPDLVFAQLGTVRHRGLEISLAGEPVEGLNVVAGAVLMKPRVTGTAVDLGLVGRKPVGQPERSVRANLDYRLPWLQKVSVGLGIQHLGPRPGSVDNALTVPGRTLVDLSARYRFNLNAYPATLRFQLTNLFDDYAWNVTGSGGFRRVPPRRASVNLLVDF